MSKLRDAPTRDIIAESLAAADKVRKVAVSSGNLKGGYVKALNKAFLTLKTALSTISFREGRGAPPLMTAREEIPPIKTAIEEEAREENMRLHKIIRELQRKLDDKNGERSDGREKSIPPPPPPPSPPSAPSTVPKRTKRGPNNQRRKKEVTSISSEEETEVYGVPSIERAGKMEKSPGKRTKEPEVSPAARNRRQQTKNARQPPPGEGGGGKAIGESRIEDARRALDEQIRSEVLRITETIKHLEKQKARLDELIRESRRVPVWPSGDSHPPPASHLQEEPVGNRGRGRKKKKKKKTKKDGGRAEPGKGTTFPKASLPLKSSQEERAKVGEGYDKGKQGTVDTWVTVVKRGNRKPSVTGVTKSAASRPLNKKVDSPGNRKANGLPKPPRTAAVIITCPPGEYKMVMREARAKVSPIDCGIPAGGMRTVKTATGAISFEIPGEDNTAKADNFAAALKEALENRPGVRITRPVKMTEIRITGFEPSVSEEELALAIATDGECRAENVRIGKVSRAASGMGAVWAKCPLIAARILVRVGSIRIG